MGVLVSEFAVLPDEQSTTAAVLKRWADAAGLDLIITTGGTGVSRRDVTPEATREVIDRELPGVQEVLRSHGQQRNPHAMLSRGTAGVRGRTLIVNLPGSTGAVNESMDVLFPWLFHAFDVLRGGKH
jgi:molybdenum cofactor synthesis domain-containing protein